MGLLRTRCGACALLLFGGCGDDGTSIDDAGTVDATTEPDADREMFCNPPDIRWLKGRLEVAPGGRRRVRLSLHRDFCEDLEIQVSAADGELLSTPSSVEIEAGQSRVELVVEGVAVGTTELIASYTDRVDELMREARIPVRILEATTEACAGSATGVVGPGEEVRLDGDLNNVGVGVAEGAARDDMFRVEAFEASVRCVESIAPSGFTELGPAISFGPAAATFNRELALTIPVSLAPIPELANRGHIQFVYEGPGVDARIVPVASPDYESHPGFVTFFAPRLGTYQAVIANGVPQERDRSFTFRGITGVSMGSSGAALVGMHNAERFDFVGPLGGPVDWIHLLSYIYDYHLGGFCTEAERVMDPMGCAAGASTDRTPPRRELFEVRQDFEHWYYVDEWGGHGSRFDRDETLSLFRDLTRMYGNANSVRVTDPNEPNITPPGVPHSELLRSAADRCREPVRIAPFDADSPAGTGFFDDEFNPDGTYPVITFCDGAEIADPEKPRGRDVGVWDGGPEARNTTPAEVVLAVDINDNGQRDAGEPVVRQLRENFVDCGLDQLCNEDEPNYDENTNPDPNGDDYDFQYNPTGTEGNYLRDFMGDAVGDCVSPMPNPPIGLGEVFHDVGLDGVPNTAQLDAGGFDFGQDDGCWTISSGMAHMLANNPRSFALEQSLDVLRDLDFFSDGGLRDLFGFAVNQNQLAGAFTARGLPLQLYNSHASLRYDGSSADDEFQYTLIDWRETGKYVHVRYGDVDASEGLVEQGDGQHVGTPTQLVNRLLSVLAWMSARWPGGDRERVVDQVCMEVRPGCPQANQFTFDFTSPTTGRTGPVSIVLPPGYFDDEYRDTTYPVVYLLHGYGMEPQDLIATGILIWTFMTARTIPHADRFQKMILVYPDGRCRGDECLKGTFYADAPSSTPGGAQMETFLLDLMDHVDATYRTREAGTFPVVD